MKKKEWWIILAILLAGLLAQTGREKTARLFLLERCKSFRSSLEDRSNPHTFARPAQSMRGARTLHLDIPAGGVILESSPTEGTLEILPTVFVYHHDPAQARNLAETIRLDGTQQAETGEMRFSVSAGPEGFPYQRVRIYTRILAPTDCSVHLKTRHGDILTRGTFHTLDIDHQYGKVSLEDLHVNTLQGRFRHSEVRFLNVTGKQDLDLWNASFAGVRMEGSFLISSYNTPLNLDRTTGKTLQIQSRHAEVRLKNLMIANTNIQQRDADLYAELSALTEHFQYVTDHGSTTLVWDRNLQPDLSISTRNGRIRNFRTNRENPQTLPATPLYLLPGQKPRVLGSQIQGDTALYAHDQMLP